MRYSWLYHHKLAMDKLKVITVSVAVVTFFVTLVAFAMGGLP